MKLLIKLAINGFAVWVATAVLPGLNVDGGIDTFAWVAVVFAPPGDTSVEYRPVPGPRSLRPGLRAERLFRGRPLKTDYGTPRPAAQFEIAPPRASP